MSDNKSKMYSQEPAFEGGTKETKTHFFFYGRGRGMQQKCLTSSKKFMTYIGTKYGESVKDSIDDNSLIVTEMAEPKAYATEAEFNAESWTAKEDWRLDRSDYRKIVRQINQELSKSYSVLWGQCNLALQNMITQDEDYLIMKRGDVLTLYSIIQRICHGSTNHQNCFMSAMGSVYNFHLIKGDEYVDNLQHLEAFEKRYEIIERSGWKIASFEMRDLYIKELIHKRMKEHPTYQKLIDWRTTLMSGGTADINKNITGMNAVNAKYKAYVYVKRAGFKYDNFRIELKNSFLMLATITTRMM
jgi:hypothetical protein